MYIRFNSSYFIRCGWWWIRTTVGKSQQIYSLPHLATLVTTLFVHFAFSKFWASCRIRTNDPEITNHVLWPAELKRQVGKALHIAPLQLTTFAAIKPWRIRKELAVWHFPRWWDAFLLVCTAKERIYFESTKFDAFSHHYSSKSLIQASQSLIFFAFRTGFNSPFTQMQTFSASNICLLKSTSSRSIDYSPLSTSTLHAIWPHNHQPQYNERKEPRKEQGQKKSRKLLCEILCDSDRIQTCNLLIRSQMLYSVELRSHSLLKRTL